LTGESFNRDSASFDSTVVGRFRQLTDDPGEEFISELDLVLDQLEADLESPAAGAFLSAWRQEHGNDLEGFVETSERLFAEGSEAAEAYHDYVIGGNRANLERYSELTERAELSLEMSDNLFFMRGFLSTMYSYYDDPSDNLRTIQEVYRRSPASLGRAISHCLSEYQDHGEEGLHPLREIYGDGFIEAFQEHHEQGDFADFGENDPEIIRYVATHPEEEVVAQMRQVTSLRVPEFLDDLRLIRTALSEDRPLDNIRRMYGNELMDALRMGAVVRELRPVSLGDRELSQEALDIFLEEFEIEPEGERDADLQRLGAAIREQFGFTYNTEASRLITSALDVYERLGTGDARRRDLELPDDARAEFIEWLSGLEGFAAGRLGRAVMQRVRQYDTANLPSHVLQDAFESHLASVPLADRDLEAAIRQLEQANPSFIREASLGDMFSSFEETPSGELLDRLQQRYEYARDRLDVLQRRVEEDSYSGTPVEMESGRREDAQEIESLQAEISGFGESLLQLGISESDPLDALSRIRAGFVYIEDGYMNMVERGGRSDLVVALDAVDDAPGIFRIYARHLHLLDEGMLGLFSELERDLPPEEYMRSLTGVIRRDISYDDIEEGRQAWFSDYYYIAAGLSEEVEPAETEEETEEEPATLSNRERFDRFLLERVERLDGLSALAFARYAESVNQVPLTSSQRQRERILVTGTVARLHLLSPELVVRYFTAVNNLATICQDNPAIYIRALIELSARVSTHTRPFVSSTSSVPYGPVNTRRAISTLENAFSRLTSIDPGEMWHYGRLELMDDTIEIDPETPNIIRQERPRHLQGFSSRDDYRVLRRPRPYPLPPEMRMELRTGSAYGGGNIAGTSYQNAELGVANLPNPAVMIRPRDYATLVGRHFDSFLNPRHYGVAIPQNIPGSQIRTLSLTRLLNNIQSAFVNPIRPQYSSDVIGGGGAGSLRLSWPEAEEEDLAPSGRTEFEGSALGSVITRTGGASVGVSGQTEGNVFAGGTAAGVPIARIVTGEGRDREIGIESTNVGYQLEDETHHLLSNAITEFWDPENPSQMILGLNYSQTAEDQSYSSSRIFYIDRQGNIIDLRSGSNDFVEMLNFVSGQGNLERGVPSTVAFNVEPTVGEEGAGGAAAAVDIGRPGSALAHFQLIPFEEGEVEGTPRLYQWTLGYAHNVEETEGEELSRRDIWRFTVPGQYMSLRSEREDEETGEVTTAEDQSMIQDVNITFTRMEENGDAWEITGGAGLGYARDESSDEPDVIGRGGLFFRIQRPTFRIGGGLSYEGGQTAMEERAILDEAESTREYLENLHRATATVYGQRTADRYVLGAFANIIAQFREADDADSVEFDNMFGRFIGLFRYMESTGIRATYSRASGLDRILQGYRQLRRDVGNSPQDANRLVQEFRDDYVDEARQIFDRFSLGVRIGEDFSIQAAGLFREGAEQPVEQVGANILWTFNTGFFRAYTSIPVRDRASGGDQSIGIVGAGIGFGPFNEFMNRVAFDGGIILGMQPSQEATDTEEADEASLGYEGGFIVGAARLYTDYLSDSSEFAQLLRDSEDYNAAIARGDLSAIPEEIRRQIPENMPVEYEGLGSSIIDGENGLNLSDDEVQEIREALYMLWFVPRYEAISEEFQNRIRVDLMGSGYIFENGDFSGDIGLYFQFMEELGRAFAVASWRPETGSTPTVFTGVTIESGRVEATGNIGIGPTGIGGAGALTIHSENTETPLHFTISVSGRTVNVPNYAAPLYRVREPSTGDFDARLMFFLTIGEWGRGPVQGRPNIGNESIMER
jgi:hypothetical protein